MYLKLISGSRTSDRRDIIVNVTRIRAPLEFRMKEAWPNTCHLCCVWVEDIQRKIIRIFLNMFEFAQFYCHWYLFVVKFIYFYDRCALRVLFFFT